MRHVPWSQGTDFSHGVKAPHACLVTFAIRQEHAAFQTFQGIIAVSKQLESLKRAVFIQPAMCSCCSPPTAHLLTWEPAADGQKDRSLSFVCPIPSAHRCHMGRCATLAISRKLMREEQCARRVLRIRFHLPRHEHSSQAHKLERVLQYSTIYSDPMCTWEAMSSLVL